MTAPFRSHANSKSSTSSKNSRPSPQKLCRALLRTALPLLVAAAGFAVRPRAVLASGGGFSKSSAGLPSVPMSREQLVTAGAVWFVLFTGLALLHAAEYVMSDDDLDAIEEAYQDTAKQEWSEVRETFKREFAIRQRLGLS